MDDIEQILRDIDVLRESINLDIEDVKHLKISGEQLQSILREIDSRKREIERLQNALIEARKSQKP